MIRHGMVELTDDRIWKSCPARGSYVGAQALYVQVGTVHCYGPQQ